MSETTTAKRTAAETIVVAATPEEAYDAVASFGWTRWSPEAESCEWLDGATEPVVGARFKGANRRGKSKWSTTCEVLAADRGRELAFAVGKVAKPTTSWRYRFRAVDGGTEVEESWELPKALGFGSRLLTRVTTGVRDREADLTEGMRVTLAGLQAELGG